MYHFVQQISFISLSSCAKRLPMHFAVFWINLTCCNFRSLPKKSFRRCQEQLTCVIGEWDFSDYFRFFISIKKHCSEKSFNFLFCKKLWFFNLFPALLSLLIVNLLVALQFIACNSTMCQQKRRLQYNNPDRILHKKDKLKAINPGTMQYINK